MGGGWKMIRKLIFQISGTNTWKTLRKKKRKGPRGRGGGGFKMSGQEISKLLFMILHIVSPVLR